MTTIEKYKLTDHDDCIEAFRSNVPEFFSPQELTDFRNWLDKNDCPDFCVVKRNGSAIGFGGFYLRHGKGRLVWGVIHRQHQRMGLGRLLTTHRIKRIKEKYPTIPIGLETTELTYKHYEKLGFKTTEITPKYYYNRFDKYEMVLQPNQE
jgi:ribosomal protein S18 acetylase RimI-like enzyme